LKVTGAPPQRLASEKTRTGASALTDWLERKTRMARMLHRRLIPRNWLAMAGVARLNADLPLRKGAGGCRAEVRPKPAVTMRWKQPTGKVQPDQRSPRCEPALRRCGAATDDGDATAPMHNDHRATWMKPASLAHRSEDLHLPPLAL